MSTRSRDACPLQRLKSAPFGRPQALLICAQLSLALCGLFAGLFAGLGSEMNSASARPSARAERFVELRVQVQPRVASAYWGVADKALARPLWFALAVEDLRGRRLARQRVTLRCASPKRSSKGSPHPSQEDFSGFTEDDGWLFGSLPSECERSIAWGISPARWWVSLGGSEAGERSVKRDVGRSMEVVFEPRHLHGSWELSTLTLREGYLHYTLSHTSRVPHELSAQLTWRPCLSSELSEGVPSPYPPHLLNQALKEEALLEQPLGEPTAPGARKLSLTALKAPVGCYVLSARSPHLPWASLLEARSLYLFKASVEPLVTRSELQPTQLSLEGTLNASSFERHALLRRLKDTPPLDEQLSLTLEGRLTWPETPSIADQRTPDEGWRPITQAPLSRSSLDQWLWSLSAPLPEEITGDPRLSSTELGPAHLELRLTFNKSELTHSVTRLIAPQLLPLLPWWRNPHLVALTSLMSLLLIASLTLIRRRISASQERDEPLELEDHATPSPLMPSWSTAPVRELHARLDAEGETRAVTLSISLVDALSRQPLSGDVALSLPPPLLTENASEAPLSAPDQPLGSREGVECTCSPHKASSPSKELTLTLSPSLVERLREGESLWLWGLAEGYESAVSEVRLEHINGRLSLPLWPVREAIKRSLTALCEAENLHARFGRAALAEIRAQLNTRAPRLTPAISDAEEALYGDAPPNAQKGASLCWALSGGRPSRALPPHDARARRAPSARLGALLLWLTLSVWGGRGEALAQAHTSPLSPSASSFQAWVKLTSEACGRPAPLKTSIDITELSAYTHIAMLNPNMVPDKLIEWVKGGGRLLIALEPEGATRSARFLKRLDLSLDARLSVDRDEEAEHLEGVWWTQGVPGAEHLPPFIGQGLTRFVEGSSWFEPELTPIWLNERGSSIGYRVGVGRGTLILLGDSDPLQGDLIEVRENHIAALTLLEWLLSAKRREAQRAQSTENISGNVICPLTLVSPATIEGLPDPNSPLDELKEMTSKVVETLKEQLKSLLDLLSQLKQHALLLQLALALILGVWLTRLTQRLKAQRVRMRSHERRAHTSSRERALLSRPPLARPRESSPPPHAPEPPQPTAPQ